MGANNFLPVFLILNRNVRMYRGYGSYHPRSSPPTDPDILLWVFIATVSVCLLIGIIFLV